MDLIYSARILTMFHGTSDKFLRQILKEGLVQKKQRVWDESTGKLASFSGVYLTSDMITALNSSNKAREKFGGNRLIVVCRISIAHHPIDEDFFDHFFISHDPSDVLCRRTVAELGELVDRGCEDFVKMYFSGHQGLLDLLRKNKKLILSMVLKYHAYLMALNFEEKKKENRMYLPICYPRIIFRYSGRNLVYDGSYPVLKKSSSEWYKLYRSDMDKLAVLVGRYSQKFKGNDVSIRLPKVGYKGANRIVVILKEHESYGFYPVYLASGSDSYLKYFFDKLSKYRFGSDELGFYKKAKLDYKMKLEKFIKDKFGKTISL